MTSERVLEIMATHNLYCRGLLSFRTAEKVYTVKELGIAIDMVVDVLSNEAVTEILENSESKKQYKNIEVKA